MEKATDIAIDSGCEPVIITLGAYFEKIKKAIKDKPVYMLNNKRWETGMGSSVACGMEFLSNNFINIDAVVLMVCDQPFLNENIILELIKKRETTGKYIIASKYKNTLGVPALFDKNIFPELIKLNGKTGAKKIISKYKSQLGYIDFPEGIYDLDTKEDLIFFEKNIK